jgi:hypothetical protein
MESGAKHRMIGFESKIEYTGSNNSKINPENLSIKYPRSEKIFKAKEST